MKRFIIAALALAAAGSSARGEENAMSSTQKATLAGGCFWCIEAVFERIPGVQSATSGYIGGATPDPTYKQICTGTTGHAEAVEIVFDPARVSFAQLLETFWLAHDPTQLNRQGNDVGTQYRSAIFYHDEEQKRTAEASIRNLAASGRFASPIVTELAAASRFYVAEDYHQSYFENNRSAPYCRFVIQPKLEKIEGKAKK